MDSTPLLGYDYATIDRIVRFADQSDLPPVCLLALGLQESNLDLYAHGDVSIGGSWGCYQIYVVAHGGPPERWQGLDGLDASMAEMRARWQETFGAYGGWDAVTHDLVGFQQVWSPAAQGSVAWTETMARQRVSLAVALYALYLKRQSTPQPPDTRARDGVTALALGLEDLRDRAAVQAQAARSLAVTL